ncbi:MAG TPA: decarboxylating 6-phosphogluconate dehydrogenase [Solirubrobacteraceae bacterium]|nr:decarboxylating 6-phosphogluconate dehydrogenase [Solirubrobacteraceae bacterium]
MQLGMIGLGRMGANMVRRLMRDGHACVVYDPEPGAVAALVAEGATGASSSAELVAALESPRVVWLMVPAGIVDRVLADLVPLLAAGDLIVDGGNSYYVDDLRRSRELGEHGIHYVDCGVSGGVFGLENGYGLMAGGEAEAIARIEPVLRSLAPGVEAAPRTPGRSGAVAPEEEGWLHCGTAGAGHFVKMVHNGIEYGLMAAYAEGLNLLRHAGVGAHAQELDAETTPLREPGHYRYDLDVAKIAEVWRRGTVVRSWLLDLAAAALAQDAELDGFAGRVSDSGEGRWTALAAIDTGTPTPVLSAALQERFTSRGEADFGWKVLSAMRAQFGGHAEKPPGGGT